MSHDQKPALDGYCPVAYFAYGEPMKGSPLFNSTFEGRTYLFVSEEARDVFEKEPDRYVPAFGGSCAYGMSVEKELPACPCNFRVIDDRLYLFLKNTDTDARQLWDLHDPQRSLNAANAFWESLSAGSPN